MKKQIISILLMLIAIGIVCSGLYLKKQNSATNADGMEQQVSNETNRTSDTAKPTAAPSDAASATGTTELTDTAPTATPAAISDATPTATPAATSDTTPTATPAATSDTTPTATPAASEPTPEVTSAPDPALTADYSRETVESLTSIGLTTDHVNSLAELGVTEDEITSVVSALNITPEMSAEIEKYMGIWDDASELERKMLITLLKQMVGQ